MRGLRWRCIQIPSHAIAIMHFVNCNSRQVSNYGAVVTAPAIAAKIRAAPPATASSDASGSAFPDRPAGCRRNLAAAARAAAQPGRSRKTRNGPRGYFRVGTGEWPFGRSMTASGTSRPTACLRMYLPPRRTLNSAGTRSASSTSSWSRNRVVRAHHARIPMIPTEDLVGALAALHHLDVLETSSDRR
jgi:hypothetical protein